MKHLLPFRIAAVLALIAASGCSSFESIKNPFRPTGPAVADYSPLNYNGRSVLPESMRRVVLLPLDRSGGATPEIARELDAILLAALQEKSRFEVVRLTRDDCRRLFGAESFNSTSALPPAFIERLGREFAADGVLFVDLTTHRAYQPLVIGLRSRLVGMDDLQPVWAFDEVFDSAQPAIAKAVRDHYRDRSAAVDASEAALRSPSRFGKFAALAMFETLPKR